MKRVLTFRHQQSGGLLGRVLLSALHESRLERSRSRKGHGSASRGGDQSVTRKVAKKQKGSSLMEQSKREIVEEETAPELSAVTLWSILDPIRENSLIEASQVTNTAVEFVLVRRT